MSKRSIIKKIQPSYMDLGGDKYDASFKPREDVEGRFIVGRKIASNAVNL